MRESDVKADKGENVDNVIMEGEVWGWLDAI